MDRRSVNTILVSAMAFAAASCRRKSPSPSPSPSSSASSAASAAPASSANAAPQAIVVPPHGDYPWVPDQRNGSFQNPVLFADYSDPDVIRVGSEYYLTASSFVATPGLPILSSPDLVNWSLVTHALENLPDPRYEKVQPGAGVWAPALREHAGKFYLFAPMPDEGIYVLQAGHPKGPWTKPRLLLAGKGLIDPCPFWDDDGKAYLVHAYARSRAGIKDRLRLRPMAPDASSVLGEGEIIYHDPERQPTLEGPKLYKRNGYYYVLAPAGGVTRGWQLALRSRNIFGPYEARKVLEQGSTPINGPHQGALVETPKREWWFVHFQDLGVYGRVVHLNPVTWSEDWPLMGQAAPNGVRAPVLSAPIPDGLQSPVSVPQTTDEFETPKLGLAWQWQANHRRDWYSLDARRGHLRLMPVFHASPKLAEVPNLLLQKVPARAFRLATSLELSKAARGVRAGLVVAGTRTAALTAQATEKGLVVELYIEDRVVEQVQVAEGPLELRLEFAPGGYCRFAFARESEPERRMAPMFEASQGRWVGAKVGLFALALDPSVRGAYADFDYFRFSRPK